MKKILLLLVFGFGLMAMGIAQDEPEAETKEAPKRKYARATFNATKIINMQSTEIVSKGNLQFLISHHFCNLWN